MQNDVFVIHIKVVAGSQPVDGAEVHVDFNPVHLQVVDAGGNPASSIESGEPVLTFVSTRLQGELGLLGSDCQAPSCCRDNAKRQACSVVSPAMPILSVVRPSACADARSAEKM